MEPYTLLLSLLEQIESTIKERGQIRDYSEPQYVSYVHLQRLFKFAFGIPLASYIRSRKLASSIEMLLDSNKRVIDVAAEYGFEHEQTYIRAFKREFGLTPGEYRQSGIILPITPPLQLFEKNRTSEGLLFGPDIVMVPQFHIIGRLHKVTFEEAIEKAPIIGKQFWLEDKPRIHGAIEPNVYYGLTRISNMADGWSHYLSSVKIKELSDVPDGLTCDSFPMSLCAQFRYIGNHHYYDMNFNRACQMYDTIIRFLSDDEAGYSLNRELYFEKIDTDAYDGTYWS